MNRHEIIFGGVVAVALIFGPAAIFFAGRAVLIHFGWITP